MTIRVSTRTFRRAAVGPDNPLPMVGPPADPPYQISSHREPSSDIPQEITDGSLYGNPRNLFPYSEQNGYGRSRTDQMLRTVVLENAKLRAVFLPELGGRLWALTDLVTNTSLLHSPDTIQLANLALRNAWFAGGVEFNIGSRGHSPTTCSPLHTAVLRLADGTELLRMWEFERLRQVVFQLDVWLPDDSPVLFVAVRVRNPNTHAVPMYWWSNAAVPQDAGSRVVAPARSAFATAYTGGISRVDPTDDDGIDGTWPDRARQARDYFFDIDRDSLAAGRPWIVNAGHDGNGLALASTARLRGRKLFVWGRSSGGEQWQRWLSPNGERYAEIQAGLAQTQYQNLPMPAASEWTWVEAYGNARVDPDAAHGDRATAIAHVQGRVDALVTQDALDAAHRQARGWADLPPQDRVLRGSGWGALEAALRARDGEAWIDETGTPFAADTIGLAERPWLELLSGKPFAGAPTFVAGAGWEARLAAEPHNPHALLHRAVMAHAHGGVEARSLYDAALAAIADGPGSRDREHNESTDLEGSTGVEERTDVEFTTDAEFAGDTADARPAALAHRGLALLDLELPDGAGSAAAVAHYARACAADPGNAPLVVEAAGAALTIGAPEQAIRLLDGAAIGPTALAGRLRFLRARALAATGQLAEAGQLLAAGIEIADLREGDDPVADLWRQVFPATPVPPHYRFSMHEED
ncbi:MAG: DUF5107 domain-containing protein [Microbacteriaceae bacterium]|nr:MAG: DUF5107 domain-containing protein [Microbacteriaceae bacterium]